MHRLDEKTIKHNQNLIFRKKRLKKEIKLKPCANNNRPSHQRFSELKSVPRQMSFLWKTNFPVKTRRAPRVRLFEE